jgi:hypothetical protein
VKEVASHSVDDKRKWVPVKVWRSMKTSWLTKFGFYNTKDSSAKSKAVLVFGSRTPIKAFGTFSACKPIKYSTKYYNALKVAKAA